MEKRIDGEGIYYESVLKESNRDLKISFSF